MLLISENQVEVSQVNQQQMKIEKNFVTKLEENKYGIGMFCKDCELDLSIFFCDCQKYLVKNFFCIHIHVFILSTKTNAIRVLENDVVPVITELNKPLAVQKKYFL